MAIYRQIHKCIWSDPDFECLNPEEKLLFIYLFTNSNTSESGVYSITIKHIHDETGIEKKKIETIFQTQSIKNIFYDFNTNCVFVAKFRKYNGGGSPELIERCMLKEYKLLPNTYLWSLFLKEYPEFINCFETVYKPLDNSSINCSKNSSLVLDNSISKEIIINKDNVNKGEPEIKKHPLQEHIAKNFTNVSKLKIQLTVNQCEQLIDRYPKQLIQEKLEAMENSLTLGKKYRSVYLTLNNWCKSNLSPPKLKKDEYKINVEDWFADNAEKLITDKKALWESTYPNINIENETQRAYVYLLANLDKQESNFESYLTGWFLKEQRFKERIKK